MNDLLLIRHGDTEWSLDGRHTGRTDLPLVDSGRAKAQKLAALLSKLTFAEVRVSPLQRARETAALAGLTSTPDADLLEWDYGAYEGRTRAQILAERPSWSLWDDGCPGGELPADVAARCDRVLAREASAGGLVALVAHGHVLRVLIARFLGQPPRDGRLWVLGTASLTRLGHEHDQRVILGLNRAEP